MDGLKATPRPWTIIDRMIQGYDGEWVMYTGGPCDKETQDANAALIVEAVNSYDALKRKAEALNETADALRMILPLAESYLKNAPSSPDNAKLETARAVLRKLKDTL